MYIHVYIYIYIYVLKVAFLKFGLKCFIPRRKTNLNKRNRRFMNKS